MASFFKMLTLGGYGVYVWPAYGLVAGVLALHLFLPWRQWRKLNKKQRAAASHAQTQ